MTKFEFAEIMAMIGSAIGKPLAPTEKEAEARLKVYFDLLGDLPKDVLQLAAKRVCLEHKWATFPSVAELREAACATAGGEVSELSPAEAWELAWKAAGKIDLAIDGSLQRHCEKLPPLVVEAMDTFSIPALCHGKEPVGVIRAQFMKIYEQILGREHKAALLPAGLKAAIKAKKETAALPPVAVRAIANIGEMEAVNPFEEWQE